MKKQIIRNMKNHFSLPVLLLALFLLTGSGASAQGLVNVRLWGGPSWNVRSGFANVGSNRENVVQPEAGIGVSVNVLLQLRAGLAYSYTRMIREQIDGTFAPISGNVQPGSVEGTVYRDLKTHFHAAGVTAEYNVLPASGLLALYLGTGAGCLFASGNTWSLTLRNEVTAEGWTNRVTVDGHNTAHRYLAPYIPGSLSLECRVLPRTYLCLGGQDRFVLSKNPFAPKGQAGVTLGLRLTF